MIKKGNSRETAFTLVELMIVISIMGLLALGIANVDWNRLSDRQKTSIFKNRIVSQIETIRNNALFGKAVTLANIVPNYWKIDLDTNILEVSYSTGGLNDFRNYSIPEVSLSGFESIENVRCGGLDISSTASILIQGIDMSLTGAIECSGENTISLDLNYKQFSESIEINSVSGLIKTIN